MPSAPSRLIAVIVALTLVAVAHTAPNVPGAAKLLADSSGAPGGICVVLGSTDAALAVALSRQGQYTVQALYPDRAVLDRARAGIRASGTYGAVSADLIRDGRLPYTDNLITIIVVENCPGAAGGPSLTEMLRVLAPLGTVYLGDSDSSAGRKAPWARSLSTRLPDAGFGAPDILTRAGTWVKAVKPWPADIDEWSHYLHGPDGNPVAEDRVVGPPKHYQWISEPTWLRSHESDSSVRTIVTARGRLFYIADDAPISLLGEHDILPDKWSLTARDAFNGVLLWRVPIEDWGWRAWKPSWFTPRPGDIPLNIEKRLVAAGDRVYVTLGYRAPVSELDAKTGEVLRTYRRTARTGEMLYHGDTLILTLLRDDRARVGALDPRRGRLLWTSEESYAGTTTDYYRFRAMRGSVPPADVDCTLDIATDGTVIALLDGADVVCLDYRTGKEQWRSPFPLVDADSNAGNIAAEGRVWTGTVIVKDGVVVHASPNQLAGFAADSGRLLWRQPKKYLGHLWYEWKDVFVIDGLVWTWSAEVATGKLEGAPNSAKANSRWPTTVNGYDLHTGELSKSVPLGNIFKTHHHHRCYRNKATSRYILASRRGSEFVDLEAGKHSVNNWVRGTCHVGMMPANGLQYAPPHPCVCYIAEKINGMNALAPASASGESQRGAEATSVLERGLAYGKADGDAAGPDDWPAFRHDSLRTGSATTTVPTAPRLLWREPVGAKVAPPVVVGDMLFAPLVDEHHVAALSVSGGKRLWECPAGARIDSPPTYYRGTLIFGSADGWVYCVGAADGSLVWRFRAAPAERRIGAFSQLESAWPVHGSVLVLDGVAYFAAGRSSHLDGGIYLYGIDARTGEVRCRRTLAGPSYNVDNISQNYRLPMGSLPDILLGDGDAIFMRSMTFNTNLEQERPNRGAIARVFARGGLLDDSYFKRAPWSFPKGGYARLVVHDARAAYSVRMFDSMQGLDPKVYFTPGAQGYLLFATDKQSGKQTWSRRIPVRVNAMVATDELLFVAGPPDVVDPKDPLAAFEGRKGGVLSAVDTATGETRWDYSLPAPPVFNGMAAARGRLYLAMQDGSIACFGK